MPVQVIQEIFFAQSCTELRKKVESVEASNHDAGRSKFGARWEPVIPA